MAAAIPQPCKTFFFFYLFNVKLWPAARIIQRNETGWRAFFCHKELKSIK
jgi:hypothetical protein